MRNSIRLTPLALFVAVALFNPKGDALFSSGFSSDSSSEFSSGSSTETKYRIVVGRLDGIFDVDGLDDPEVQLVRVIVDSVKRGPLPDTDKLTAALAKAFGSATAEDGDIIYTWEVDPDTGEWIKVCIEIDRILVAPTNDPNPILVRLVTRVILD